MSKTLATAATVSHRFASQGSDVAAPASGYGIFYVKSNRAYFRPTGGSAVLMSVSPKDETAWGTAPDDTLSFAGQLSSGSYRMVNGSELRSWDNYQITADTSLTHISDRQYILDSATDRTVTITSILDGQGLRAYAIQVSGGTGHKILLPASHYWGSSGTNRAALFNAVDDYIDAVCYDVGGGIKRMLIYTNGSVTFAAS